MNSYLKFHINILCILQNDAIEALPGVRHLHLPIPLCESTRDHDTENTMSPSSLSNKELAWSQDISVGLKCECCRFMVHELYLALRYILFGLYNAF